MQQGSDATQVKVSFLAVVGPETTENVTPYVNTLISRHCDLVLAVGPSETAALAAQASAHPALHFAVVGAQASGPNIAALPASDAAATADTVKNLIINAFHGDFHGWSA